VERSSARVKRWAKRAPGVSRRQAFFFFSDTSYTNLGIPHSETSSSGNGGHYGILSAMTAAVASALVTVGFLL
jgi:hypothetical protein